MLENINLKDFPQESGVYWFINENDEIIYVGSSKNIYRRMIMHRHRIRDKKFDLQKDFYNFLRNNKFNINFEITEDYEVLEMQLVLKYKPKFNINMNNKPLLETHLTNKTRLKKLCNYNGEIITLRGLAARFYRAGIKRGWHEASKYVIKNDSA